MRIKSTKSLQKPIFHDHDGSVDDFVALINLLLLDKYRLTGVSVTNGNCYIDSAIETTLKIFNLFCRKDLEVSRSNAIAINEFPTNWREKNSFINNIPILQKHQSDSSKISKLESVDFTAQKLLEEEEKTTIILTGPATNLANTFAKYPEAKKKVKKILWMTGAFLTDGNVKVPDHDGSAEWNIFWDAPKAKQLLEFNLPVVLFPLDICRQLPVDNYVMYHLKKSNTILGELTHELFNPIYQNHSQYFMWDVLPTVYMGKPELFEINKTAISIEQRGTSVGNIYRSPNGSAIKFAKKVHDEAFYDYLIDQFKKF